MADHGLTGAASQIEVSPKQVHTRSVFKQPYHFFNTHRFGELSPHFVMEGVPGDRISLRSAHDVRSFTLKAPLMQDIELKKDYFTVPNRAILPLHWDKVFNNPTIGDDVDATKVNSVINAPTLDNVVTQLFSGLKTSFSDLATSHSTDADDIAQFLRNVLVGFTFGEMFASHGSLMASLGIHFETRFKFYTLTDTTNYCWDSIMDHVFATLFPHISSFVISFSASESYDVTLSNAYQGISLRYALTLIRENPIVKVSNVVVDSYSTGGDYFFDAVDALDSYLDAISLTTMYNEPRQINLSRLLAYQLVCAHYYSNDAVDFIYSADLLRQLMHYFNYSNGYLSGVHTFTYNGISHYYDDFSGYEINRHLMSFGASYINAFFATNDYSISGHGYAVIASAALNLVFQYRRSLRYLDYFSGSRTRPLAVGDTSVSVMFNQVDVVDVTRKIQAQRFLNAVNRSGRKAKSYIQELFGVTPQSDQHDPQFLAHTSDVVFGAEIQNTADAQVTEANSITTRLQSNGSRYAFEFDVLEPCVIVGISYYDIPRVYSGAIERQAFHVDRFDMFNPYLQFVGDQQIYRSEIGAHPNDGSADVFGYTTRHMEYKMRFNQAAGAFVKNLPGFIFDERFIHTRNTHLVLSPEFIRSSPSELDSFYLSLTGYSFGSYFHFIVDSYNDLTPSRPMSYSPSIL